MMKEKPLRLLKDKKGRLSRSIRDVFTTELRIFVILCVLCKD